MKNPRRSRLLEHLLRRGLGLADVVADTLESVERIVDAVDSVRRQAGERPYRTDRKP